MVVAASARVQVVGSSIAASVLFVELSFAIPWTRRKGLYRPVRATFTCQSFFGFSYRVGIIVISRPSSFRVSPVPILVGVERPHRFSCLPCFPLYSTSVGVGVAAFTNRQSPSSRGTRPSIRQSIPRPPHFDPLLDRSLLQSSSMMIGS